MTDLDVYQPAALGQYQAGIVMTPESAKALDEQVRLCTEAVLREGTDYGIIPGTNGEKTLWRPGAQKLLQWFRLECICERIEVERDDDGRKHGITYRAEVGRGLKTATPVILATCEGTADYDESKFYQTAEEVQRKAKDRETMWAEKYRRPRNPEKWQGLGEYRADWNALMKRAQKRAIVGAVNDATAAGGIFTDREEDDHAPAPKDDGPSWTETAIEQANTFTDIDDGRALYLEAAQAHKRGDCSRRQQDLIQNTVTKRVRKLQAATVVDVEDLGRQATSGEGAKEEADSQDGQPPAPARASTGQLSMIGRTLKRLGVDDENRPGVLEKLAGRDLARRGSSPGTGRAQGRSTGAKGRPGRPRQALATGQLPGAEKTGDTVPSRRPGGRYPLPRLRRTRRPHPAGAAAASTPSSSATTSPAPPWRPRHEPAARRPRRLRRPAPHRHAPHRHHRLN